MYCSSRSLLVNWLYLCVGQSPGCQWDDFGYGFLPHYIHLPLYLGDQRSLLLSLNRPVCPWRWWQPDHFWRLQRGVLLAPPQHSRGPSSPQTCRENDSPKIVLDRWTVLFWCVNYILCSQDAKVMSWWDYGYQITAMANRTILVDNNTWNNTHISRVGQVNSVTLG